LLEKAIKSIKPKLYSEYIIFNNSGGVIPASIYSGTEFRVWNPEKRKTFMETQNIMRHYAIEEKFDFYSFMHNDGEVLDNTDIELVNTAKSLTEDWGVIFTHYDVLCAFNTRAVKKTGEWGDKKWAKQETGYLLDNDYYRRIKLCGFEIKELGGNVSHVGSNTIKDPKEHSLWESQMSSVYNHYISKWGGEPGQEIYVYPYNEIPII
jgi:hypothetical protein